MKTPIRTGNRLSDRSVRAKIQQLTGMTAAEAKYACRATVRAIYEMLMGGRSVALYRFGSFHFRFRRGRTIRMNVSGIHHGPVRVNRVIVQPDKVVVKFKPSHFLSKKMKDLKPADVEHLQMPKKSPIHYTPKP